MSTLLSGSSKTLRWTLVCGVTAMALSARGASPEAVPSQLLSDDERVDFCTQMHRAATPQERNAVAARMRDTLTPRAKGQGVALPSWVLEGRPANGGADIPGLSCQSGAARPRAPTAIPAPVPTPAPVRVVPERKPPQQEHARSGHARAAAPSARRPRDAHLSRLRESTGCSAHAGSGTAACRRHFSAQYGAQRHTGGTRQPRYRLCDGWRGPGRSGGVSRTRVRIQHARDLHDGIRRISVGRGGAGGETRRNGRVQRHIGWSVSFRAASTGALSSDGQSGWSAAQPRTVCAGAWRRQIYDGVADGARKLGQLGSAGTAATRPHSSWP